MFDNLLSLVKEHAGDAIVNNPAIPNEKNDEAISTTTNSIVDTLKSQVTSGKLSSITDLFKGGDVNASSVSSSVQNNVVSDLMKKFGVDNAQATSIAQKIIPTVMEKFVKKTNDPNDKSFDLNSVMSSLSGADAGGMLGKITSFFK
jgi:uncharacterized protein YidB (DUF937 family)